jgi:hypothetical protein
MWLIIVLAAGTVGNVNDCDSTFCFNCYTIERAFSIQYQGRALPLAALLPAEQNLFCMHEHLFGEHILQFQLATEHCKQSHECLQGAKLAQQASEDGLMYLQHSRLVEVAIGKVIRDLRLWAPCSFSNNDDDITSGATYQGSVWKQTTQPKLVAKPWQRREHMLCTSDQICVAHALHHLYSKLEK